MKPLITRPPTARKVPIGYGCDPEDDCQNGSECRFGFCRCPDGKTEQSGSCVEGIYYSIKTRLIFTFFKNYLCKYISIHVFCLVYSVFQYILMLSIHRKRRKLVHYIVVAEIHYIFQRQKECISYFS